MHSTGSACLTVYRIARPFAEGSLNIGAGSAEILNRVLRAVFSLPGLSDFDLEHTILSLIDNIGNIDDGSVNVVDMSLDIWLHIPAEAADDGIGYRKLQIYKQDRAQSTSVK